MQLDRQKGFKLIIVIFATLAALAVMSTLVQLIQTVLPFLIVGAGFWAAYRWAFSDAPAPKPEEVEEQARGLFRFFRRTKKAVETSAKVNEIIEQVAQPAQSQPQAAQPQATQPQAAQPAQAADTASQLSERAAKTQQIKDNLGDKTDGPVEFKDRDVVISEKDIENERKRNQKEQQQMLKRLADREKQTEAKVTNEVWAQIEERRRKQQSGG